MYQSGFLCYACQHGKLTNKEMKKTLLILSVLLGNLNSFSQTINGEVTNSEDKSAISFVSIGVMGMDIGTVSDIDGTYHLTIGSEYDEETLLFSYIGFESYEVQVKEFRKATTHNVQLTPIIYELQEVVVTPNILGTKTLGHTGNSKKTTAGFGEYKLGFEHAVRMKLSKNEKAVVENIHLNIARCTFDSLHYRVNIYSITGKKNIKSVLKSRFM